MKSFEKYEIPYGEVYERFHKHFDNSYNTNILFSGKFGIGKTTFLNSYLSNRTDAVIVRLSPVNYTVSSNENIFELIKVDIIKQLYIQGYIDFGKEDYKISSLNAAVKYAIKHPLELGRYLSKSLSKLNPIAEFVGAGFAGVHELIKSCLSPLKDWTN